MREVQKIAKEHKTDLYLLHVQSMADFRLKKREKLIFVEEILKKVVLYENN